jgi:hypothetical protein
MRLLSYLSEYAEVTTENAYTQEWNSGADGWSCRASLERLDRLSRLLDIAFLVPETNIDSAFRRSFDWCPRSAMPWLCRVGYFMKPIGWA